ARSREVEPSTGPLRQLARPGDKVGMDVSLGDVGDSEAVLNRSLEVPVNIPVGVDDQRFTGGGAAEQVTGLSEPGVEEPLEDHSSDTRPEQPGMALVAGFMIYYRAKRRRLPVA